MIWSFRCWYAPWCIGRGSLKFSLYFTNDTFKVMTASHEYMRTRIRVELGMHRELSCCCCTKSAFPSTFADENYLKSETVASLKSLKLALCHWPHYRPHYSQLFPPRIGTKVTGGRKNCLFRRQKPRADPDWCHFLAFSSSIVERVKGSKFHPQIAM